jgi:hypothetical protein
MNNAAWQEPQYMPQYANRGGLALASPAGDRGKTKEKTVIASNAKAEEESFVEEATV